LPVAAVTSGCSFETWPNISTSCLKVAVPEGAVPQARRVGAEHG
jgi:hypothetical protein